MTEEERAALYRAEQSARFRAWMVNHRVTLAPARGSFRALLAKWDPIIQAQRERNIVEPVEPPFDFEAEDPPYPMPKRNIPKT